MKAYSVRDQPEIDHIAGKTIYPMTIYPGRCVHNVTGKGVMLAFQMMLLHTSV